jgi:hypothetical protein
MQSSSTRSGASLRLPGSTICAKVEKLKGRKCTDSRFRRPSPTRSPMANLPARRCLPASSRPPTASWSNSIAHALRRARLHGCIFLVAKSTAAADFRCFASPSIAALKGDCSRKATSPHQANVARHPTRRSAVCSGIGIFLLFKACPAEAGEPELSRSAPRPPVAPRQSYALSGIPRQDRNRVGPPIRRRTPQRSGP